MVSKHIYIIRWLDRGICADVRCYLFVELVIISFYFIVVCYLRFFLVIKMHFWLSECLLFLSFTTIPQGQ